MGDSNKPRARDLRLDFFRGLSLFLIFIDHIPENVLGNFTLRAFAFSDAAEVFIFISGYTAAQVYGRTCELKGFAYGSAQVLRRVWQLYIAHIAMFMVFMAEVSYSVQQFDNPAFNEELRVGDFLAEPHIAIGKALTLEFQPPFLDILPLYIVLLLLLPLVLFLLRRNLWLALIPSAALYILVRVTKIDLPAYPEGHSWYFNPLAWQFLFVIGATLGYAERQGRHILPRERWVTQLGFAVFAVCTLFALSWTLHEIWHGIPALFVRQIDKTSLALPRLVNFLALALVVTSLVPRDAAFLKSRYAWPVLLCGRNSLPVFCLGILLSVLGHFLLAETDGPLSLQLAVIAVGFAAMIGLAVLITWYKNEGRLPRFVPADGPSGGPSGSASGGTARTGKVVAP
jgi:hypothetical protein